MDDRAEFEKWWNDADDPPLGWERMSDGRWVPLNYELWEMWEAWQAATARQRERDAQKIAQLVAKIEDLNCQLIEWSERD